jgi:nitrogenase subunit NifH
MNTLPVYKKFIKVYYAVVTKPIGGMYANCEIRGVSDVDHEKCRLKLCDWVRNNEVDHKDVRILSGYVADMNAQTGHVVYDPNLAVQQTS